MSIFIKTSIKATTKPIKHFWSTCVGAGRANEGLRAGWLEHLKLAVEECGFQYLRFHGLFYDDMFVYRKVEGKDVYNWQYIDDVFDRMLYTGIRPFVEFGFSPVDMGAGEETNLYWKYKSIIPHDLDKWGELITKSVTHWIERYGMDEVKKWYFEVWNEPNLSGFWSGTKSKYFELYKVTVKAIKAIHTELRVGGPATSNFVPDDRFAGDLEDFSKHTTFEAENIDAAEWKAVWMEDFIDYCAKEKLPVDFFSTHPYPTDFALDGHGDYKGLTRSINSTQHDLKWMRDLVDRSPYPTAEIHLTEWSSSPSSRDHSHDYLPAAAFIIKTNLDSTGLADSLSYWTFTDVFEEMGGGDSIFHGGFGMINFQGIVKPSFHAYRFLNQLGDLEITREDGCIVTKDSVKGKMNVLAYNYPEKEVPMSIPISEFKNRGIAEETQAKGSIKEVKIELEDLKPGTVLLIETLDGNNGFALKTWIEMGMPEPPNREQTQILRDAAMNTKKEYYTVQEEGRFKLKLQLMPWNVVAVREL